MKNYVEDYFVINSENTFFTFKLNHKNALAYKMYDNEFNIIDKNILKEKDVLKYSICIDNKDNIHILSLLKSGSLHLQTYNNKTWEDFVIGEFDLESNKYHQLELLFINGKFHIIYSYSNLINSNISTIQHIVYKKNIEQRYNVIRYVSKNKIPYFSVDYDSSGTIHILYNTITNTKSYIYHCFYSPFRKVWSNNPKSLWEGEKSGSSYIFIDKMDSIHSLWLESKKDKYNLSYKKMNTKGRHQYIWNHINFHISLSKDNPFIMYEKDKKLYLCFIEEKNIIIFKSEDYGESWKREDEFKISEISRVKTIANQNLELNLKINHILDDFNSIKNSKLVKKLFPNILAHNKDVEFSYIKDKKYSKEEKNNETQIDIEKLEEIIKNLSSNQNSKTDEIEEKIIKDLFVNNISNFEEPEFLHIENKTNENLDESNKSIENEDNQSIYIDELKWEINELKSQIKEILNSQRGLEDKIASLLVKEDSYEREILKIKEEIKELQVPMIKKLFG